VSPVIYSDAHDVGGPITTEQGQTEDCPECKAVKGQPCTALSAKFAWVRKPREWYASRVLVRAVGTPLPDYCHPQRRSVVRERYRRAQQAEYQRRRKEALGRLRGPSADALAARAAMLAWDASEYAALTSWWREHGHLFANAAATRPDGSVRGRSYATWPEVRLPVSRTNWLGVVIWLLALTTGLWAPYKPAAVAGTATLALSVIGLVLLWWPRR